jgi:hypothetical protein
MSKSNILSKKDFINLRSGQTYWEVTKNQFGVYRIVSLSPLGKKIKSFIDPYSNNKRFSYKNSVDFSLFFPVHKLFWSKKSAEKFAKLHAYGMYDKNTVMNIVNRVRQK